ncbi:putative CBL-interacting protein kinase 27 [Typha latifolia]|uniref:putative CBL-interacting protein kinase 27 n=1 Tax=Typha latifolia TaxID=4733 RepID=UPI003C2C0596
MALKEKGVVIHGRYQLGRLLGCGNFAKVYVARDLRTNEDVAMKVVSKEMVVRLGIADNMTREISAMKRVAAHPNIVHLHEVMATKSKIYLVMDLVGGGDLLSKLGSRGHLTEDSARRYFSQLISAVAFCHSCGVYHRDLKPENLLIDDAGDLKLADFGLSALAEPVRPDGGALLRTSCGTPAYVAPEMLEPEIVAKKGYDGAKADLWSCGVILFVLLAGFLPFRGDNLAAMYKKIQRGEFECPPWFSSGARRVITKLLDPNPGTRITVEKLVEMTWFKKSLAVPKSTLEVEKDRKMSKKDEEEDKTEMINAFHIISMSEGLDLSPLFKNGGGRSDKETSRLEALAARAVERSKKDDGESVEFRKICGEETRPAIDAVWSAASAAV